MDEKQWCIFALVLSWVVLVIALIWIPNRAGLVIVWVAGGWNARAAYDLKQLLRKYRT